MMESKVSKRIEVPGVEALRVRKTGDTVELVLIDDSGQVQLVPVELEEERKERKAAA